MNNKPTCYIIAGPNGAGKTTFAIKYLPDIVHCKNFINVDLIAKGLSPFDVKSVEIQSSKLFLNKLKEFSNLKENFSFETTLSGIAYLRFIKKIQDIGFHVTLFYLWIPSANFSYKRVCNRVKMGGHDIPKEAIFRRYRRCNNNLIKKYMPICDEVYAYDNSTESPKLIFEKNNSNFQIFEKSIYQQIKGEGNE